MTVKIPKPSPGLTSNTTSCLSERSQPLFISHLCCSCPYSLYSNAVSRFIGLVCRTQPGRLSGDHKVRAVGGRRLHLHSQHQAGETGGCFRENHAGSGEGRRNGCFYRMWQSGVFAECLPCMCVLFRWVVQCGRPQVILPPTDRPSPLSQGRRMVTVYT